MSLVINSQPVAQSSSSQAAPVANHLHLEASYLVSKFREIITASVNDGCIAGSSLTEEQLMEMAKKFVSYAKRKEHHFGSTPLPLAQYDTLLEKAAWINVDGHESLLIVDHELGSGGMCTVRQGITQNGEECAIKCMNEETDPCRENRFLRSLAQSNHVIRRHASNEWYRVEEKLQGDLADVFCVARVQNDGLYIDFLKEYENKIMKGVLQGLVDMHQKGIVYFDVKNENILLTDSADVRFSDFGLASLPEDYVEGAMIGLPRGMMGGTPLFMAPEQIRLIFEVKIEGKPIVDVKGSYPQTEFLKCDSWQAMLVFAELKHDKLSPKFQQRFDEYTKKMEELYEQSSITMKVEEKQKKVLDFKIFFPLAKEYHTKLAGEITLERSKHSYEGQPAGLFSDLVPENEIDKLLMLMSCFNPPDRITAEQALVIFNDCIDAKNF